MPVGMRWIKGMAVGAVVSLAAAVGGCADGGVELQGGVFDALGVSSNALASKKAGDVKVPERQTLVLPPGTERLPLPGDDGSVAAAQGLPVDPEARKVLTADAAERQQREVCEQKRRDAKIYGTPAGGIQGPMGACDSSILQGLVGGSNSAKQ